MTRWRLICSLLLLLISSVSLWAERGPWVLIGRSAQTQNSGSGLLSVAMIQLVGSFRLNPNTFDGGFYFDDDHSGSGTTGMFYNDSTGTLFVSTNVDQHAMVEVNIPSNPTTCMSGDQACLPIATNASAAFDATGDYANDFPKIGSGTPNFIGGFLIYNGHSFVNVYRSYDNDHSGNPIPSVYKADYPGYANPTGAYYGNQIGGGATGGWWVNIPTNWQGSLGGPTFRGLCCVNIDTRTTLGPAAFITDPDFITGSPATPFAENGLLYYAVGGGREGRTNQNGDGFHSLGYDWTYPSTLPYTDLATNVGGAVFPINSDTIIFFGRNGSGPLCYGVASNCNDPSADPSSNGFHSAPYHYQIWMYDAHDLLRVKLGQINPWDVNPYAMGELYSFYGREQHFVGGVAYDKAHDRIFVHITGADVSSYHRPIINVYQIVRS